MKLIIDPKGGFSGDMFISSLISLGADYNSLKEILSYSGKLLGKITIGKTITNDNATRLLMSLSAKKDYIKGNDALLLLENIFNKFNIKENYRNFGRTILNNLISAERKAHSDNIFINDKFYFKPIGKIISDSIYNGKKVYAIEIFDKYAMGLKEIEQFSHIFIISFLDQSTGYSLSVTPPWENRNIKIGVFSSRSPNRPNPIGLNTVKIYGRNKNIIFTEPFDIYNNTPILDIKPVIKSVDKNDYANNGWLISDKHLDFHSKGIPHKHDNEDAYLHEAQDIIIDISGAVMGMQLLELEASSIIINEVSLGGGEVFFSHGKLPVPAPATKIIIEKFKIPFTLGPIQKELCTPTGASILSAFNLNYNKKFNIIGLKKGSARGSNDYDIPPLLIYKSDF